MSWSCWESVRCLETWQSYFKVILPWAAVLTAVLGITQPLIERRIAALLAPRHLSEGQKKMLRERVGRLADRSVYVYAYATSEESQRFAAELGTVFQEAGWRTRGPVLYYMTGEKLPEGVAVLVQNRAAVSADEQEIMETFEAIGLERLTYQVQKNGDHVATHSVGVRVGLRPKP